MNSLDALAATAMEGAGIGRRPSWRAEADLAAGHLVRLLADDEPAPVPLHLMFQPCGWASPKVGPSSITSSSAGAASIRSAHSPAPTDKQNHYSILKPCQTAVVYQAADQSRFIAS
jgi:hypothetical protein